VTLSSRVRPVLITVALVATFLAAGCAHQRSGTLTILHTNDQHSQFAPAPATWVQKEPKPLIGGMVALENQIRKAKATYKATLLLDAGDFMTGTPIAKLRVEGALGGAYVQMLNHMGYQALTIGNHEFDEGQENLFRLINLADYDVLSANLYKNDQLVAKKPYAIYKISGLRVGVIGLTLTELFEMTAKKNLDGIRVLDPAESAQKAIDEIDGKTDLIILLTHMGVEADRDLAQKVRGADIIVGGHSHSRLNKPIIENGVIIVQADSKSRYLGRLSIDVAKDAVIRHEYALIPCWVDSVAQPDPILTETVKEYSDQINADYGRTIGQLKTDWQRDSQGESNIGDYIADVMRKAAGADFALINSGGIRKEMAAGPIKKLDIVEILPFTNSLVTFACSGEELLKIVQTNVVAAARQEPGILQISGLSYQYRISPGGLVEINTVLINGKPVDLQATYLGATIDFVLFGQTDRYFGFTPAGKTENTNLLLSDVVMAHIEAEPSVESKIEGRIVRLP
jgi:2',3'-cyclic-nucleotide 2'-phosphodiesterase (5'-nucleotidase family)